MRLTNSTGTPAAVQSHPTLAARSAILGFDSPGMARPDRSPLMSATNTGTPCAESCSARSWSVLVLPVPVAPATSPWRFIIASGMQTFGAGWTVVPSSAAPSVTLGPVEAVAGLQMRHGRKS